MGQTFPNTHYVTTVITKKSKITIQSWKTTKDTKATTETQRRTSKIIQNNHSHKYYSGETREHHQQRPQNDFKYLQWLQTCVSIKDENKHQATKTTSVGVQLSGGGSGGFQHFLEIYTYPSVVCRLSNNRKTNWSGSTLNWDSKTHPCWQQSLAPMQRCNNYWISILKGHHQDTLRKVWRLEKGWVLKAHACEGKKTCSGNDDERKTGGTTWVTGEMVWFGSLRVGHGSGALKSMSRTDYTTDRKTKRHPVFSGAWTRPQWKVFRYRCKSRTTVPGHKGARFRLFSSERIHALINNIIYFYQL